jgi:hypothetical protein
MGVLFSDSMLRKLTGKSQGNYKKSEGEREAVYGKPVAHPKGWDLLRQLA